MRIQGPGITGNAASTKKAGKKASGGGFSDALKKTGDKGISSAVTGVADVSSLYLIQEVGEEATGSRRKYVQQGFDAIDYLNELRMGLLTGHMPVEKMKDMQKLVDDWRQKTDDPKLNAILNEIEIRARVELAKAGLI